MLPTLVLWAVMAQTQQPTVGETPVAPPDRDLEVAFQIPTGVGLGVYLTDQISLAAAVNAGSGYGASPAFKDVASFDAGAWASLTLGAHYGRTVLRDRLFRGDDLELRAGLARTWTTAVQGNAGLLGLLGGTSPDLSFIRRSAYQLPLGATYTYWVSPTHAKFLRNWLDFGVFVRLEGGPEWFRQSVHVRPTTMARSESGWDLFGTLSLGLVI